MNGGFRVPGPVQTNQVAEIHAVARSISLVPPFVDLHIVSDSKYVVEGITRHLTSWEDKMWIAVSNATELRDLAARLRARSALTTFRWVKGHDGTVGNEEADRLAAAGAEQDATVALPQADMRYLRSGLKLAVATQRLAYQAIRLRIRDGLPVRRSTAVIVDRVIATLAEDLRMNASAASLWKSIRCTTVLRESRDFWWRSLHGALRIGKFWTNLNGYEDRAMCHWCEEEESLEHILVHCAAPGQREVWRLVAAAAAKKGLPALPVSFGTVLGSPMITLQFKEGRDTPIADAFYRSVVPMSAHLIWKLRCERVIDMGDDRWRTQGSEVVCRKWWSALERRSVLEVGAARRGGTKSKLARVQAVWHGILESRPPLGQSATGFLVGRPVTALSGVG
ncbi:hypothetical protein C8Q80DRAFT_1095068 [Daedaleopsis nitida]|nr:hypothetical protein C8Q80DRAFT_1095068 [Daedaleopsis nitida]